MTALKALISLCFNGKKVFNNIISAHEKDRQKSPSGELLGTMRNPAFAMVSTEFKSSQSLFRSIHSRTQAGHLSQYIDNTMSLQEDVLHNT